MVMSVIIIVQAKVTEFVLFNDLGWYRSLLGIEFDRHRGVGRFVTPALCCVIGFFLTQFASRFSVRDNVTSERLGAEI
jgi:hypothetical protein